MVRACLKCRRSTLLLLWWGLICGIPRRGEGFCPLQEVPRITVGSRRHDLQFEKCSVSSSKNVRTSSRSIHGRGPIFSSRDAWESFENNLPADFDSDDLNYDEDDLQDDDIKDLESANQNPLMEEYVKWKDALEKCVLTLDKKQKSLQTELEKAENVEETVKRAELITSNMYLFTPGVRTATVNDWNQNGKEVELTLNESYGSASEEADALFQQARKLKRGSQIVRPLLAEIDDAKQSLEEIQIDFDATVNPDGSVNENVLRLVQDRLLRSSKKTGFREPPMDSSDYGSSNKSSSSNTNNPNQQKAKPAIGTPASNLRKFTSPGGCVVIVGRNRRGNEYLTFNIARGDDIWMQ